MGAGLAKASTLAAAPMEGMVDRGGEKGLGEGLLTLSLYVDSTLKRPPGGKEVPVGEEGRRRLIFFSRSFPGESPPPPAAAPEPPSGRGLGLREGEEEEEEGAAPPAVAARRCSLAAALAAEGAAVLSSTMLDHSSCAGTGDLIGLREAALCFPRKKLRRSEASASSPRVAAISSTTPPRAMHFATTGWSSGREVARRPRDS